MLELDPPNHSENMSIRHLSLMSLLKNPNFTLIFATNFIVFDMVPFFFVTTITTLSSLTNGFVEVGQC